VEHLAGPAPDRIDLVQVRLGLREAFSTAAGSVRERSVVLVAAHRGAITGWGECAPFPGHMDEDVDRVWAGLATAAPVVLAGEHDDAGDLPATARAGLVGALADLAAREAGEPLWRRIGGVRPAVAVSAAVGLAVDAAGTVAAVAAAVAGGYRHVKLKVAPGRDVAAVRAVRERFPDTGIGLDANGSYDRDGAAKLLGAVDGLGIAYLEQPLRAGDLMGHAALRRVAATPICLDESAADVAGALAAIAAGAGDVLNVKPGRLGLTGARAVHDAARAEGVALRVGGLVETGVGRAHALAVATLAGCTLPADLTATGHWFTTDPAVPPTALHGGRLDAPRTPGIGVDPDPDLLAACTVRRAGFG
jgi:o-succinylbenzoate synthase